MSHLDRRRGLEPLLLLAADRPLWGRRRGSLLSDARRWRRAARRRELLLLLLLLLTRRGAAAPSCKAPAASPPTPAAATAPTPSLSRPAAAKPAAPARAASPPAPAAAAAAPRVHGPRRRRRVQLHLRLHRRHLLHLHHHGGGALHHQRHAGGVGAHAHKRAAHLLHGGHLLLHGLLLHGMVLLLHVVLLLHLVLLLLWLLLLWWLGRRDAKAGRLRGRNAEARGLSGDTESSGALLPAATPVSVMYRVELYGQRWRDLGGRPAAVACTFAQKAAKAAEQRARARRPAWPPGRRARVLTSPPLLDLGVGPSLLAACPGGRPVAGVFSSRFAAKSTAGRSTRVPGAATSASK
jgi:hypothetical protein